LKLDILTTRVYSCELLTDFTYTNFIVSYRAALDRLRVHLNSILFLFTYLSITTEIVYQVALHHGGPKAGIIMQSCSNWSRRRI